MQPLLDLQVMEQFLAILPQDVEIMVTDKQQDSDKAIRYAASPEISMVRGKSKTQS